MATGTSATLGLWAVILGTSLILTGCFGADSKTNSTETYTVGSILVEPFLMRSEEGHVGGDAEYDGFIPDLLHEISSHIGPGVKFKITLQPDGKFGSKKDDGSWDGLMGSLIRNDIHVAAAPLTITYIRERVIDFSKPFMSSGMVLVISGYLHDGLAPPSTSDVIFVFRPFSTITWFMLIAAVLMIIVFAVIIYRLKPQAEKTGHTASVSTLLTTCSSGGRYSGCVLRATMVNFVLLTMVLYTAGVVSLLLYNTRTENAELLQKLQQSDSEHVSIDELVNSGQYKMTVVRDGATHNFFRVSKIAVYERIYDALTYVDNITAGFELVRKDPGYAFITDRALVDSYTRRQPYCGLNTVGPSLTSSGFSLGLPLGSPLRETINMAILQMREDGVLQRLNQKWWYKRVQCGKTKHTVPGMKQIAPATPRIGSTAFGGVLIILAIGLLLAVGVAVLERFLHLRSSKNQPENDAGKRSLRDSSDCT